MTIEQTLAERGKRYGEFYKHAFITQRLKAVMQSEVQWQVLTHSQQEALEMIAHKIGRILNGDPNYADSWHDIAGYAKLVEDELNACIKHVAYRGAEETARATQAEPDDDGALPAW